MLKKHRWRENQDGISFESVTAVKQEQKSNIFKKMVRSFGSANFLQLIRNVALAKHSKYFAPTQYLWLKNEQDQRCKCSK